MHRGKRRRPDRGEDQDAKPNHDDDSDENDNEDDKGSHANATTHPADVWALVFLHLPLDQVLVGCARVCKQWRQLAKASCRLRTHATAAGRHRALVTASPHVAALCAACPNLASLSLAGCWRVDRLAPLAGLSRLRVLCLSRCGVGGESELAVVGGLGGLRHLELDMLSDGPRLEQATGARRAGDAACFVVRDCEALEDTHSHQHPNPPTNGDLDLSALGPLRHLHTLTLRTNPNLTPASLHSLARHTPTPLPSLCALHLCRCPALTSLEGLRLAPALAVLDVSHCSSLSDLRPLEGLVGLRTLRAAGTLVSDLACLAPCTQLRELDLSESGALPSLRSLPPLPHLHTLFLAWCGALDSLAPLASHCPSLRVLDVSWCECLVDVGECAACPALAVLDVSGTQLRDASPLLGCVSLATLHASGCYAVGNLDALVEMGVRVCQEELRGA